MRARRRARPALARSRQSSERTPQRARARRAVGRNFRRKLRPISASAGPVYSVFVAQASTIRELDNPGPITPDAPDAPDKAEQVGLVAHSLEFLAVGGATLLLYPLLWLLRAVVGLDAAELAVGFL